MKILVFSRFFGRKSGLFHFRPVARWRVTGAHRWSVGAAGGWCAEGVLEEVELAGAADAVLAFPVDGLFELVGGDGLHLAEEVGDVAVVVDFLEVVGGDGGKGGVGVDLHLDDVVGVGGMVSPQRSQM